MSESENKADIVPIRLGRKSGFTFECHKGVSCFTKCCRGIDIILTPYDIIRLKNKLELSSEEFLAIYTEPHLFEKTDLPVVTLKLLDDDIRSCPFVRDEGCLVYEDRPTTCRYYPVGMADFHEGGQEGVKEDKFFFLVKEPHCKGFEEPKQWTIGEWRADQGVNLRDEMNKEWLRLVMRRKSFGRQATLSESAQRMFFMASTDLDHFRRFIFESSFSN